MKKRNLPWIFSLTLAASVAASVAKSDSLAGAYLAARHADIEASFSDVVSYGTRVLSVDSGNIEVLQGVTVAELSRGHLEKAVPYARRLVSLDENNQIAQLVLLSDRLAHQDWKAAEEILGSKFSFAPNIDRMIQAWISIGEGKMSVALAIFDELAEESSDRGIALFHKALAMAYGGDYQSAADILGQSGEQLNLDRDGLMIYAQILTQLGDFEKAEQVINRVSTISTGLELDPFLEKISKRQVLDNRVITDARDGISLLIYAISDGLFDNADHSVVLLYNRVAEFLSPENVPAKLLSGELLLELGYFDLSLAAYGAIPDSDYHTQYAALGRTNVLRRAKRYEEAVESLHALIKQYPETVRFQVALGDVHMVQDQYAQARDAYDQAVKGFTTDQPAQWATYFQRAIASYHLDDWNNAEAGFRKSLSLQPDQANVLNYLGYSLVERHEKLEEALTMIKRAVALRPESGYIVDSLGWGLFQLGQFEEAVTQMERAVELEPVDPILNDHLGDTYWAAGRYREARFQWTRALSFITETSDLQEIKPDRIRRKLQIGLDAILEEEGHDPLKTR